MFACIQLTVQVDFGFPDTCNTVVATAVVPIPYPNIGTGSSAVPAQYSCYTMCCIEHNFACITSFTSGDEAGVSMGVASGTIVSISYHITCSVRVFIGGVPAVRWLDATIQNTSNAPGSTLVAAQYTVMIFS